MIGIPGGDEYKQEIGNLSEEIMLQNFPNQMKEKDTQIQGAQKVPNEIDPKRPTQRHIIIKMA